MTKTIKNILDPKFIEKQNKAFHRMSKKKQRIAIAKDVLLQLKLKTLTPTPGTYERILLPGGEKISSDNDLQMCLLTGTEKCEACGLGAAFLSLARLGNEVRPYEDTHRVLRPIFGEEQTILIEHAFEGWKGFENEEKTTKFHAKYPDPTKRMAAIFKNIIKNDGTFVL